MQGISLKFKAWERWALIPTPTMPLLPPINPLPPTNPPCRCHPLTQNPLPHKSKSHYPLPPNTHIHCHRHATSQINPQPISIRTINPLRHHRPPTQTHSATTATQPTPPLQGRQRRIGGPTPTSAATTTTTRGFGFEERRE